MHLSQNLAWWISLRKLPYIGVSKSSFTRPQAWQNCSLSCLGSIDLFWHLIKDFCCSAFKMCLSFVTIDFPKLCSIELCLNLFPCQNLYKKCRKIRCQNIPHNTCIFLVSYRIKIPGTMNTLDLMWFIPSVISNIESRTCSYLPAHFMFTSPMFIQVFFHFYFGFLYQVLQWLFNVFL